ncbi:hypothetical protein [Nocardia sp. CA-119907]|uniref:hypothetical protein n=1 Tax=Nocardia sp. CA-119907 TaxID=3239973 RepID=UPI003D98F178
MIGTLLTVAAIAIILVLAVLSGAEKPPTRSTNLLLGVVAASFQVAAGWLFSGVGKADPSHAEASARRLVTLGSRVAGARALAEQTFDRDNPKPTQAELRVVIGNLSVHLSYIENAVVDGVDDWRLVHGVAVERALQRALEQARGQEENGD